jgi:hypothetical protein
MRYMFMTLVILSAAICSCTKDDLSDMKRPLQVSGMNGKVYVDTVVVPVQPGKDMVITPPKN